MPIGKSRTPSRRSRRRVPTSCSEARLLIERHLFDDLGISLTSSFRSAKCSLRDVSSPILLQALKKRTRHFLPLGNANTSCVLHRVDECAIISLSARTIARESSKYPVDRVLAEYRYVEKSRLAFPVDRANDATASIPRELRGGDGGGGGSREFRGRRRGRRSCFALIPRGHAERTLGANTRKSKRRGHGSKSEFGYPRFALANGRANDADTSGHKASGNSSLCARDCSTFKHLRSFEVIDEIK